MGTSLCRPLLLICHHSASHRRPARCLIWSVFWNSAIQGSSRGDVDHRFPLVSDIKEKLKKTPHASSPFFLFFNPALLEAQLKPVLEYAALPRWKWPFAPHDLGTYPLANGQVYGGGEQTEENQMPVEESGNMLILVAALGRAQGNWHWPKEYWPQFTKWAEYLRAKGLDPENQLSTDDFAGHLAHNANLSIKAIEGIAAYAQMASIGEAGRRRAIRQRSKTDGRRSGKPWPRTAITTSWPSTSREPGARSTTWSGISCSSSICSRHRCARRRWPSTCKHLNLYGLPLDNRADYTKLDWEIWTGTLANTGAVSAFMDPIGQWINEGPSRVPLTDWYDTKTAR